jgi:hypothetical protein
MAAGFEELGHTSAVLYGESAGIWVMILYAPPVKADMLAAGPTLAAMQRKSPEPFPTLTWVLDSAGYRMDADARQAATDVTKSFAAAIGAQATLIEGAGFQGAAVRAIIAGMDAVSRTAAKKKVFSALGPATSWCLESRVGGLAQADAAAVTKAIGDGCTRLAKPRK